MIPPPAFSTLYEQPDTKPHEYEKERMGPGLQTSIHGRGTLEGVLNFLTSWFCSRLSAPSRQRGLKGASGGLTGLHHLAGWAGDGALETESRGVRSTILSVWSGDGAGVCLDCC